MQRTIRHVMAVSLVALSGACQPLRTPEGPNTLASGPTCVAYNAAKVKVECNGPPDSFTGDDCTCIDSNTGESYLGRIRNGM